MISHIYKMASDSSEAIFFAPTMVKWQPASSRLHRRRSHRSPMVGMTVSVAVAVEEALK